MRPLRLLLIKICDSEIFSSIASVYVSLTKKKNQDLLAIVCHLNPGKTKYHLILHLEKQLHIIYIHIIKKSLVLLRKGTIIILF